MAQGSVQALGAQQGLRAEIDAVFAAAGPGVWQDHRNAAAAVTYVLSGGSPQTLRELTELDPKPAIDERLLTGVLAYAEGRETDAAPLLANVDAADLPASMGAQVAIAQSALAVGTDPAEAMRLLAMARLLAPGTLAEEAAIRRQIFVADQLKDFAQVQSLARQYLDRFRHSVYAGNFRVRFAAALSHMDTIDREESFPELDDMLVQVEPDARCRLYLTVALASVIDSRTTAAKLAAERASRLALAGSAEEARARLYHAGALAAVPKMLETAVSDLAGVDRKLLSSSDQALYEVVEATIAGVRSGTDRAAIKVAAAEPLGEADLPAESAALQRARDALKAADAMLDCSTQ
jgi:chemotaxis protein MotC